MSGYACLHAHSEYSLEDGCMGIVQYLEKLKEQGIELCGLLDRHNLFAAYKFQQQAFARGIKPVIGIELIIGKENVPDLYRANRALRILVENQQGYSNLCQLLAESYQKRPQRGLFVTRERLAEKLDGLFVLGPESHLGAPPWQSDPDDLKQALVRAKQLYKDRFYFELPLYDQLSDRERQYLRLADELDIETIITHPAYYPDRTDSEVLRLRIAVQENLRLAEMAELPAYRRQQFIADEQQMRSWLGEQSHRLDLTERLARRCYFELREDNHKLPSYPCPESRDSAEYLEQLCREAVDEKSLAASREQAVERLEHELKVIISRGFSDYFLIVADIVNWARKTGIAVGPGRGSAAGALIAYLLGITEIDPFQHDLIFERFLNDERREMPDIDLDFADRRRDEVIDYIRRRFGDSSVLQIITFNRIKARTALRDLGRIRGEPQEKINRLLNYFPADSDFSLDQLPRRFEQLEAALKQEEGLEDWYDQAKKLEGLVRNSSIHAAGLVIGNEELDRQLPVYRDSQGGLPAAQFDMYDLNNLGYLKLDILGLTTLTLLELTLERIPAASRPRLENITRLDSSVRKLLMEGSLEGIFQFETAGCRDLVRRVEPRTKADLMACLALYRPGPLQSGMVDSYLRRRSNDEPVEYPHPDLQPVLEDTYGIIIYQEQVMEIARVVAGFSWSRADLFRRAMGKKNPQLMASLETEFIEGGVAAGYDQNWLQQLFSTLANFAQYGFNRSHSAAYAEITFRTAYLKAHYPREFYAALCTVKSHDRDRIGRIARAMESDGLQLCPPRINSSGAEFSVASHGVRYGLSGIKNIGSRLARRIEQEQDKQPFDDLTDFFSRLNPRNLTLESFRSLAAAGYFDPFKLARAGLVDYAEDLLRRGQTLYSEQRSGQENLFQASGRKLEKLVPPSGSGWSFQQRSRAARDVLGYYSEGHPLEKFLHLVELLTPGRVELLQQENFTVAGLVAPAQLIAFCSGQSREQLQLLGEQQEQSFPLLPTAPQESVKQRVVLCEMESVPTGWRIKDLQPLSADFLPGLNIYLTEHQRIDQLRKIQEQLVEFPGESPVRLVVNHQNEQVFLKLTQNVCLEAALAQRLQGILGPGHLALFNSRE